MRRFATERVRRLGIRTLTQTLGRVGAKSSPKIRHHAFGRSKQSKKRIVKYSLFAVNLVLLVMVVGFVLSSRSESGQAVRQSAAIGGVEAANPLDQLSSSDIAVHLARMTGLPESDMVVNQADSIRGQMAFSTASTSVAAKPQIVSTASTSYRDIQVYVSKAGDTVAGIASRFGVTSDSVIWSNELEGVELGPGRQLFIPPINGIVYLVKAGDTPANLASKFSANRDSIIAFNDAEVQGLVVGRRIVIPGGVKQAAAPASTSSTSSGGGYSTGSSFAWGNEPIYGGSYPFGWCTYYAAMRGGAPSNWGNANTWDDYAGASGWTVSSTPRVGAIAQTDGGWGGLGHVGIVDAVSPDGSMIRYSDMNGIAGWGGVGSSGWVPAYSSFQRFIYR